MAFRIANLSQFARFHYKYSQNITCSKYIFAIFALNITIFSSFLSEATQFLQTTMTDAQGINLIVKATDFAGMNSIFVWFFSGLFLESLACYTYNQ